MPGGQGGGGSARPTAGEAISISGRIANTTADKALCCSQGFIAHLLSVAFCVEILRFVQCPGTRFNGPALRRRICVHAMASRLIVGAHRVQGALPLDREPYDDFSPT